ncbi:hypothetical protein C8E87_6085 [Paractinoplanes brasiliensis]|uniref:Uncharacterized protein n=1 Tax=Paractinoplanes brasiliensis TaxID=52695 RepID=A0A4R6K0P6_9ACTN|nr:hypothetical protein C8E87_6085 [Actinoplanes brasiliensis]
MPTNSGTGPRDARGTAPLAATGTANDREGTAAALAAELRDLPASVWPVRSRGAASSYVVFMEDEVALADLVVVLWDIARSGPFPPGVTVQSGVAGVVVLVNGPDFSVAGRSGGPVLVVSDRIRGVLRIDRDPSWHQELSTLIGELIAVGQGAEPFDESVVPPPPRMPWHRDR